jgi:hypothetical protein
VEFASAEPTSLESVPKRDRVHLPGEFINAPQAAVADLLACRIERNAVELAESVDFVLMRADVAVLKRNMLGAARLPSVTAAPRMKAAALHQQLRQARDGVRDPSRLVGRQMTVAERPFL